MQCNIILYVRGYKLQEGTIYTMCTIIIELHSLDYRDNSGTNRDCLQEACRISRAEEDMVHCRTVAPEMLSD